MCLKCMWMCAVSQVNMHGRTHFNAWSLSAAHSYLSAAHACMLARSCSAAGNHTLTVSNVCHRVLFANSLHSYCWCSLWSHVIWVCGGSAEKSRGRSSKTLPKLSEVANTHTDTLSSCHWRYWLGNQVLSRIILTFALLLLLTPQTYRILHHRENYGRSKLALTFSHCNM